MQAEKKLASMGIQLLESSAAKGMYLPGVRVGNMIYISGQGPFVDGKLALSGHVGAELTLEQGQDAARICAVNILSVLKNLLGDLDKVKQIANLQAFVNSGPDFHEQHLVVNGASQLLFNVFGEAGRHSRTAVGTSCMPFDMPVEIQAVVAVKED